MSVPTASIASVTFTQTPFGKPRIDDLTFDDGGTSVPLPISGNHTTTIDFSQEHTIQLRPPGSIVIPSVFATVIITNPGGSGNNGGAATPEGTEACTGSRADNIGWTYYHDAYDYLTDGTVSASECGACGCAAPVGDDLPGQMQRLRVKRLLRPTLGYLVSSFGPTMFGTFDAKIRLYPGTSTTQPHADVFDVESNVQPVSMLELSSADGDNTVDGIYHDVAGRQYKDLRLTDSSGHAITQAVPGALAVLTKQTGERLIFEIVNTQSGGLSSALDARLTRTEDRNHNAEIVSYVFAASATDSQLSNDRTRLWQIKSLTDAYGAAATFQYGTQQVSGRWVVTMITAPSGEAVRYSYAGGTNIGLTGITFADGSSSSFSTTTDPVNQEIRARDR